jgi:hypothetical protein
VHLNTGVHNFEVCAGQSGSGTHVGMIVAVFHADVWGDHFVTSLLLDIPTVPAVSRHTWSEGNKPIVYGFVIVAV